MLLGKVPDQPVDLVSHGKRPVLRNVSLQIILPFAEYEDKEKIISHFQFDRWVLSEWRFLSEFFQLLFLTEQRIYNIAFLSIQ